MSVLPFGRRAARPLSLPAEIARRIVRWTEKRPAPRHRGVAR